MCSTESQKEAGVEGLTCLQKCVKIGPQTGTWWEYWIRWIDVPRCHPLPAWLLLHPDFIRKLEAFLSRDAEFDSGAQDEARLGNRTLFQKPRTSRESLHSERWDSHPRRMLKNPLLKKFTRPKKLSTDEEIPVTSNETAQHKLRWPDCLVNNRPHTKEAHWHISPSHS